MNSKMTQTINEKVKSFVSELWKSDRDRRLRGDDLGIYLYIAGWFFIGLLFTFSNNKSIQNSNTFYLFFDVVGIFYIIFHYVRKFLENRKKEKDLKIFDFPHINDLGYMIAFVIIIFGILFLFETYLLPPLNQLLIGSFESTAFNYVRVIGTEEITFRGIGYFLIYYSISTLINHSNDSKKTPEKYKMDLSTPSNELFSIRSYSRWKKNEIIINYITILITGIIFGLYHFPKFFVESTFPYFYLNSFKFHIAIPVIYLTILGLALGLVKYKYGLSASIFLHFLNNFFATAIIYPFL